MAKRSQDPVDLPPIPVEDMRLEDLCDPVLGRRALLSAHLTLVHHAARHGWGRMLVTALAGLTGACQLAWEHGEVNAPQQEIIGQLLEELSRIAVDDPDRMTPHLESIQQLFRATVKH